MLAILGQRKDVTVSLVHAVGESKASVVVLSDEGFCKNMAIFFCKQSLRNGYKLHVQVTLVSLKQ